METEVDWTEEVEKCALRLGWTPGHSLGTESREDKTDILGSKYGWSTSHGYCYNEDLGSFVLDDKNFLTVVKSAEARGWEIAWVHEYILFTKKPGPRVVDRNSMYIQSTQDFSIQDHGIIRALVLAFNAIPDAEFGGCDEGT